MTANISGEVSAGFDAGDKAVASVKLAIPAGTAKNVTVRTTGDCALTIDAADSDVDHYGTAGSVDIQAVAADTYTLYGTVTSFERGVFSGCTSLASVTVSAGVTSIGSEMFYGCTSLATVVIPASVASIGSKAFSGCASLSGIDLSANGELTSISVGAFSGCTALASVELPAALETIESDAFNGCALTSVTLPASLQKIGMRAFYNTKITSVTIPASVTFIGGRAFAQDGEPQALLTSIVFENPEGWLYNGEEIAAEDLTGEKAVETYNQSLSSLFASWTRPEE